MTGSEREYINLCKRLIEEKFNFQNQEGTLRQRDLEYLADNIESKSGIKLSLSTLKRLWKKDYDQMPHPSTLQALVSVLGYTDWQEFKLNLPTGTSTVVNTEVQKSKASSFRWIVLPILIAVAILFWLIAFRTGKPVKPKPIVKGPVIFTGNKTVSQGVPNTIIFNYDVSNVEADSFFFQQSWNYQDKVKIDPKGHYYSNIYYYPGFHKAKLIANDSILKRFMVHITTEGWMPLVRYSYLDNTPVYINKFRKATKGSLHISKNELSNLNVNLEKDFIVSYYNVREFENTYSDNFSLDTKIVCDKIDNIACPGFEVVILCEAHIFFVRMMKKGCERDIGIKMGEVYHDGASNDLSVLGQEVHTWQHLQIQVVNKKATISLNKVPVYTMTYKNDFGKVVGLVYNFTGTGAVDYVKLQNGENKIVYEDHFNE